LAPNKRLILRGVLPIVSSMLLYFIIFILRIDVFNFLLIQNRIFIGLHHKGVRIDALGNKRISALL
jgi:hypothetical protein